MKLLSILMILAAFGSCSGGDESKGSSVDDIIGGLSREDPVDTVSTNPGQVDFIITPEVIAAAEATELMVEKAAAFREASIASGKRNGIYVYSGATFDSYITKPEKLAARIYMLGYKDVHLSPGSSRINNASDGLRKFIAACSRYGINVYAVSLENLKNLVNESNTTSEVNAVLAYNNKVASYERFKGMSADLEPHTCHDSKKPSGIQYTWDSTNNYGKGKDNDQLLGITLERLGTAGTALHSAGLELCEAIFYNYQIKYNEGLLENGSVPQFLESCDFLVTMAYLPKKENIWNKSKPVVQATEKPNTVSICIKTRINADSGETIQHLGWNYLLETVRYVNGLASAYPSYRGLDMFTFDGIETMWEWLNDKD